ncbi:MAG TPA: PDZ domain-containing protein, partial [Anaerolineae bacterium]|nr:PDZ domain-containing protein [Anaerolineae bacterium]
MMKRQMLFSMLIVALLAVALGAPLASAQTEQPSEPGLVIVKVDPDGPAAEAGVKRGDILLAMDGQEINRPLDWFRALRSIEAGKDIELQVLHGDDERTLAATVAERNSRPFLGIQVYLGGAEDTTEDEPLLLPLLTAAVGAEIVEVVDDSPASAAGLQVGDVITAVDNAALDGDASLADVIGGYEPGDEVTLTVVRAGSDEAGEELTVVLGENPDDATRPFLG